MEFGGFKDWMLLGLLGGGVVILWNMYLTMISMNTKLAVVITDHQNAKKTIDDHEVRLRELEK